MPDIPTEPAALLEEQNSRWQSGERVLVEDLLVSKPWLQADPEAVLDLVTNEMLLRQQTGETPRLEEYQQRFPHLAKPLALQFEVEQAIDEGNSPLVTAFPAPTVVSPSPNPGGERAPAAVPGPPAAAGTRFAPVSDQDLVHLLRKRLRFLLVVFALYFGVILLLHLSYYTNSFASRLDFWASAATFIACLGLVGILSGRSAMTLRQLRLVEFLLFAVFGVRMILRGYVLLWHGEFIDRIQTGIAAGDVQNARDLLTGLAYRLTAASAMFVVAYGVIIPNTWRRCALVVTAFTLLPIVTWLAACVTREVPAAHWFSFQNVIAFLVVILTAVLSVYGAYRIESSRQEAAEARRLGPYTLVRKLGSGGMGEVHLAEHRFLKRPCAVKLIRVDKAADPELLRRFEREVQATARLTHPNAIQVFDYGHTPDGTFYYAMEYLPGLNLDDLVKQHGPLPPGRAVHLLRQVCGALREAHATGLIHRDIKPGNVIVCQRGGTPDVAKLLDFGLVRDVSGGGAEVTSDEMITGTPAYMAPEQASGGRVDARADIYALGGLAYFLLTGEPPFAGRSAMKTIAAHLYESPAPLSRHRPDFDVDLEAIVLRCLAKAPSDRFPDVASLDAALATYASGRQWSSTEAAEWWLAQAGASE